MKDRRFGGKLFKIGTVIMLISFLYSCGQTSIPQEIVGDWETRKIPITVRSKDENRKFIFIRDSAIIKIIIKNDHTVDGLIGSARIENGKIKTNWLLPVKMSGLAFTIKCGKIGKIFENDPLNIKEVEFWVTPFDGNKIDADLRYTQGVSYFPMARTIFTRERNK